MTSAAEADRRCGFTLLEVMVALGLFAGGFLAVAHLSVVASRVTRLSQAIATATRLADGRMEQLRSLAWGYAADGSEVGSLSPSPAGTLVSDTAGFVDYLDDRGAIVGSGLSPPASAMFVRRWSVEWGDAGTPPKMMTLCVVVLRKDLSRSLPAGAEVSWVEEVRLVGARSRRPG